MLRLNNRFAPFIAFATFVLSPPAVAEDDAISPGPAIRVEAQPLSDALKEFSDQTGLQLAYVSTLAHDKVSKGVEHAVTPVDALDAILEDTGLQYRFVNDKTVAIGVAEYGGDSDSKNFNLQAASTAPIAASRRPIASGAPNENRSQPAGGAADDDRALEIEEILVTGSRIARENNSTSSSPLNVFGQDDIQRSGVGDIGDFLNDSPLLRPNVGRRSAGSDFSQPIIGATFLDLRGLGSQRTLVLVDGKRHVSSNPGSQAVDVSTLPNALIERVEIVTGGASAVYGSDAVTGVVNFVLKDEFEGLQAEVQLGLSGRGDAFEQTYSVTAGAGFGSGRGNVTAHYTRYDYEGLTTVDRKDDLVQNIGFFPNPDNTGPNDGIPDFTILGDRNVSVINDSGVILAFSPFQTTFDESGRPVPSTLTGVSLGVFQSGGDGFLIDPFTTLSIPSARDVLRGSINYDLTQKLEFFFSGKFARSTGSTTGQPPQDIFVSLSRDNAFITPEIDAVLDAAGVPAGGVFNYSRVDSAFLPIQERRSRRQLFRVVTGFEGELSEQWSFEGYFQYGRNESESSGDSRSVSANLQSLDSVLDARGAPACRITVESPGVADDCVPRNPFGNVAVSDELRTFLAAETAADAVLEQRVAAVRLTGDLFELPAGALKVAAGVEYRYESSAFDPNGLLQDGDDTFTFSGPVFPVSGSFDVYEGFVETVIPVLSDRPLFHSLSVEGAFGVAEYSTAGAVDSYRGGVSWAPSADIRLRGGLSRAVRAPNVGELFAGQVSSGVFPQDPCSAEFIDLGRAPANRAANCAALGIPIGFSATSGLFVSQIQGGNPDLDPEQSNTYTIGAVFTPGFAPGFSLAVDYWNIEIDNAISSFPAQAVVDNCVDAPSIDNDFCALVTRRTDGNLSLIEANLINIAALESSGVDIESRYSFDVSAINSAWAGSVDISARFSYLDELTIFPNETDPADFDLEAGEAGDPHWQGNIQVQYTVGDWEVAWLAQFLNGTTQLLQDDSEGFNSTRINSEVYNDLFLRYRVSNNIELRGGVNNLFDNNPPEVPGANLGIPSAAAQDGNIYDNIGRYFFLGARVDLN